jgi:hypothetical protein
MKLPQGPVTYKYIEVGKTLYQAGSTRTPRFPARVAYFMLNALFESVEEQITLYDPFCGHGVLLVTAYLLFSERIKKVMGSDINPIVLDTARKNFQWLRDPYALEERLRAIQAYKTQDDVLKATYQGRCRLMFDHAQERDLEVELFVHDATQIGEILAATNGAVALVTDPPYSRNDHWNPKSGIESADFGPLEPFLQQVGTAPNVSSLLVCYRADGLSILPLLERYFVVTPLPGTKGRAIYQCHRK